MTSVMQRCASVGIVLTLIGLAPPVGAMLVPGSKHRKSDCYARFRVNDGNELVATRVIRCTDNDPACDQNPAQGTCGFKVALCINDTTSMPTCVPPGPGAPLKFVRPKGLVKRLGLTPPTDLASATCGPAVDVTVNLQKKKPGKAKLVMAARSPLKPRNDVDRVKLICLPCTGDRCTPPTTTTTTLPAPLCGANPNGGPDELFLRVADDGTDLDNGWTGVAHSFPVNPRASMRLCLSGCDASTNPICNVEGPTGAGSINGETFGPPLPLIASGVPVCVVNRYQSAVTGQVDIASGRVAADHPLQVNLLSDTHFTTPDTVCPSCTGPNAKDYGGTGTCDGGANADRACTVESILDVATPANTKTYFLSTACPPSPGDFAGRLNIRLPLTTDTSTLTGPTPCVRQPGEPAGVAVKDDSCLGTPCGAQCTGNACVRRNAAGQCVDGKGGISQECCSNNTTTSCFPTAGGGALTRVGRADPARNANGMPWPDPSYPKASESGVLVATFCEGATGTNTINGSTGLPGPGALILPGLQALLKR